MLVSRIYRFGKKKKYPESMKPVNKQTALVTSRSNENKKYKKTVRSITIEKSTSQKLPSGVWCTRCRSNLLPTEDVVVAHFEAKHHCSPTKEEIKKVLANSSKKMFTSNSREIRGQPA